MHDNFLVFLLYFWLNSCVKSIKVEDDDDDDGRDEGFKMQPSLVLKYLLADI